MRLIDADGLLSRIDNPKCRRWFNRKVSESAANWARFLVNSSPTVGEFPCKPLDTVYFIECRTDGNHKIRSGFALSVEYNACYKPLVTIRYNDNTLESTKHYLGLKAFMSREEAEAALAERMNSNGN